MRTLRYSQNVYRFKLVSLVSATLMALWINPVNAVNFDILLSDTSSLATGELGACSGKLYAYRSGAKYYRVFESSDIDLQEGQKYLVNSRLTTKSNTTTNIMLGYYMDATLNGVPQGDPPSSVVSGENHTGSDTLYTVPGEMILDGQWLFIAPASGQYRFRLWGRTASSASCQAAPSAACVPDACGPIALTILPSLGKSFLRVGTINENAVEGRSDHRWVSGFGEVLKGAPITYLDEKTLSIPFGMTKAEITALAGISSTTTSETVNVKLRAKKISSSIWTYFPDSRGKTHKIASATHHKKVSIGGTLTGLMGGDEVQVQVIVTLTSGTKAKLDTGFYDPSATPVTGGIYGTYTIPPQTAIILAPKP